MNSESKRVSVSKTALITGITGQDGAYLAELLLEKSGIDNRTRKTALQAEAHLISVMTLEQKGALFRECVHSLW